MKLLAYTLKITVIVGLCMPVPMLVAMQQKRVPTVQDLERAINANDLVRMENTVRRIFDAKIDQSKMTESERKLILSTQEEMRKIVNDMDDTPDRTRLQKIVNPQALLAQGLQGQAEVKRKRNHDQVSEQLAIAQQIEHKRKREQEDEEVAKKLQAQFDRERHDEVRNAPASAPLAQEQDFVAHGQYQVLQPAEALVPDPVIDINNDAQIARDLQEQEQAFAQMPVRNNVQPVADQVFPGQPMQIDRAPAHVVQQAVPAMPARPVSNSVSGWFKSNWRVMTAVAVVATLGAWWFFNKS